MNEAEFERQRRNLLDDFMRHVGDAVDTTAAEYALDYKSGGELTYWVHADIDDLLLHHIPDEGLVDEDVADEMVDVIIRFLEFLEIKGLMSSGSDPARDLAAHLENHRDDFVGFMAHDETRDLTNRLMEAMLHEGVNLDDEEAVDRWMDGFNALSPDRRVEVLGYDDDDDIFEEGPAIELPPRPPVDVDLARASAADAPFLRRIIALADYMGEGRPLTATGNLKLADATELMNRLDTPDRAFYEIGNGEYSFRSAAELRWLDLIVWVAEEVGAVKMQKKRMSATKAWIPRGENHPLQALDEIAEIVVGDGPLSILKGSDYVSLVGPRMVMEASAIPLLAGLYEGDQPFDEVMSALVGSAPELDTIDLDFMQSWLEDDFANVVRVMEWAGLLTWTGARSEPGTLSYEQWRGGMLSITPFGSWFIQEPLATEGIVSAPVVVPFTATLDDPPEEIVAALAQRLEAGPLALVEAWEELGGYAGLPEQLWRVDDPRTEPLLEALGQVLAEPGAAKAVRKALVKHRTWLADRG